MVTITNTASVKYNYTVGDRLITKTAQATLVLEDPVFKYPNVFISSCYCNECCKCICYVVYLENVGEASAEVELTNHTDRCLCACDDNKVKLTIPAGEETSVCFSYCTCRCKRHKRVLQFAKAVVNDGYQIVTSNRTWTVT